MAIGAGLLNAGKAVITLSLIDDKRINQTLASIEAKTKAIGRSMSTVATAGLKMASALAVPFGAALKLASDAAESANRFDAVFGAQAKSAATWAEQTAAAVGRSKVEIKDSLATFQSFFLGLGFGATQAKNMAQQMAAAAIDFASFNNLSDEDAAGRFISALSGSSEVLDRWGVNTRQAALETQLLAQGVHKSWSEVTEQEKAVARLNIILKTMGEQGAMGDATKTAGSFANQLKALQAKLKDIAVEIGTTLLPVATQYLGKIRELAASVAGWISKNSELFVSLATFAVKLGIASAALWAIGKALNAVALAVTAVRIAVTLLSAHPLVALATAVTAAALAFAHWMGWFDKVYAKMGDFIGLTQKSADEIARLAEETQKLAEQEARRAELQGRIAANRAATGNPWGITGDRQPVGAEGPDSDPLGFASMQGESDVKKALEAAKDWWRNFDPMADVRQRFKQLLKNLDEVSAPKHLARVASFDIERGAQPSAMLDARLAAQAFGGVGESIQREQLQAQKQIVRNTARLGGLPVV